MVVKAHFLTLVSSSTGSHLNIPDLYRNRLIPKAALRTSSLYSKKSVRWSLSHLPFQRKNVVGAGSPPMRTLFMVHPVVLSA